VVNCITHTPRCEQVDLGHAFYDGVAVGSVVIVQRAYATALQLYGQVGSSVLLCVMCCENARVIACITTGGQGRLRRGALHARTGACDDAFVCVIVRTQMHRFGYGVPRSCKLAAQVCLCVYVLRAVCAHKVCLVDTMRHVLTHPPTQLLKRIVERGLRESVLEPAWACYVNGDLACAAHGYELVRDVVCGGVHAERNSSPRSQASEYGFEVAQSNAATLLLRVRCVRARACCTHHHRAYNSAYKTTPATPTRQR
jgi:hypothetical protein